MGSSGQSIRLPGGGVDPGESLWKAAERETLEETGEDQNRQVSVHYMSAIWGTRVC
jgi:8-oxo-dGTP pyrophosphatase MutT (NUDIX family)